MPKKKNNNDYNVIAHIITSITTIVEIVCTKLGGFIFIITALLILTDTELNKIEVLIKIIIPLIERDYLVLIIVNLVVILLICIIVLIFLIKLIFKQLIGKIDD